ncbi:DUF3658 domain-containing protein [Nocardia vaccinii]|uniref:DUF3658 domain-containing protein n=1 Tax=Nocardia vaccinii TaxID=1822 RepID=UPI0008353882|nr:DUF3658 domain-containing protein [Nocardia vaccinii]
MAALHIAPNAAAGAGISTALAHIGCGDMVLVNNEDFSCGRIDPAALLQRELSVEGIDVTEPDRQPHPAAVTVSTQRLWAHLDADHDARPIVWVGRASAQELSFYLYFAARFGDRPWSVIDVTGLHLPRSPRNSETGEVVPEMGEAAKPARSVAELHPEQLRLVLDSARPLDKQERDRLAERWHTLQAEQAPLRVVTDAGLSSAPADYFDQSLLVHIPATPTPMAQVIADTMGAQRLPVNDYVLHRRLIEMIHTGRLTADGDPTIMGECRISSRPR